MIERRRGFSTENRAEAAIEIVEAKRHHCGQMARRMRQSQGCAIARMGIDAHRELVRVFERSPFRRSVFQDGELVAMGGVVGSALAPHGCVWLALGEDFAKNHPITVTREALRWTRRLMETKTALTAICLVGDGVSRRFADFLSFKDGEPELSPEYSTLVYSRKAA
jgi:hypothetical protein